MDERWRLLVFALVLVSMTGAEICLPRRALGPRHWNRWLANLALAVFNTVVLRLALPISLVAWAAIVEQRQWGLLLWEPLSRSLENPVARGVVSLLLLDLLVYAQHVAFHRIPWLWRWHRVHHADLELDASSGIRFHIGEIALSLLLKGAAVACLGIAPEDVLLFEILLNAAAMFNHANVAWPKSVDRVLRCFIVTPDMHRVHHSIEPDEMHRNFGFNVPWWDWLFGTYRAEPKAGHVEMRLGLHEERDVRHAGALTWMMVEPFRRRAPAREITLETQDELTD